MELRSRTIRTDPSQPGPSHRAYSPSPERNDRELAAELQEELWAFGSDSNSEFDAVEFPENERGKYLCRQNKVAQPPSLLNRNKNEDLFYSYSFSC
jgi:hypothetical protein